MAKSQIADHAKARNAKAARQDAAAMAKRLAAVTDLFIVGPDGELIPEPPGKSIYSE